MKDRLLTCRRYLASAPELWPAHLLTPLALWRFTRDHGAAIFNPQTIENLWQIGLLRADLITATARIRSPSLETIDVKDGRYTYLDRRTPRRRARGYGGTFPTRRLRSDIKLYFHPFRFYVLYHVVRVFSLDISTTQYLVFPNGYANISARLIEMLDAWTSDRAFCELFGKWNTMAEIAAVCEPLFYRQVARHAPWHFPDAAEHIEKWHDEYRRTLQSLFTEDQAKEMEGFRENLCFDAERLDDNPIIHVLIRLAAWHGRKFVKGHLGGSMTLLTMAELIRRAMEEFLGRTFREEDEVGREWVPGARRMLYGTERVLDAPKTALRTFLADAGIDYGIKVRCYLEGDTEHGALSVAIQNVGGVELINLSGQVVESRRKGVAFRESLQNDARANVFSFIIVDADNNDYVRAVQRAAQDDIICGRILLSAPDLEFSNFTLAELCTVLVELATEAKLDAPSREELVAMVDGVGSAKQFFQKIASECRDLSRIGKGEPWGQALMAYAMHEPRFPGGQERPIIEMIRLMVRATTLKYAISREKFRIDAATGNLVSREN